MPFSKLFVTLLLCPALAAGSLADPLAADDECQAGDASCALNALQLRSSAKVSPDDAAAATCVEQYQQCGGTQYEGLTECCGENLICYGKNKYYAQCIDKKDVPVVFKVTPDLVMKSEAPLYTFYVYRVMSNETYAPQNVNVANLPGVMWYLHNEVVVQTPRKFNIERILRFKMQSKAPKPLFDAGMNFGVRYAFDKGMCTGPWECDEYFQQYGYFVGCNNLGDFPFPTYSTAYAGGIWYSLPGACSSQEHQNQNSYCKQEQPGGNCDITPNGNGTCTYHVEMAGEINIDELVGISNYEEFIAANNTEYDEQSDKGVGMSFWNDKNSAAAAAERVSKADALFKKKYPDMPADKDMPSPACDFDFENFYGQTLGAMNKLKR